MCVGCLSRHEIICTVQLSPSLPSSSPSCHILFYHKFYYFAINGISTRFLLRAVFLLTVKPLFQLFLIHHSFKWNYTSVQRLRFFFIMSQTGQNELFSNRSPGARFMYMSWLFYMLKRHEVLLIFSVYCTLRKVVFHGLINFFVRFRSSKFPVLMHSFCSIMVCFMTNIFRVLSCEIELRNIKI